ncbi:ArsR/SmtB family transcription factor [Thalassospira lucentensis]|uniref:ArsR/SmtB family transcription factor n=1 Tax=Thalassospira lucentensis TaxID=168935 RepID=UPI003AA90DE5
MPKTDHNPADTKNDGDFSVIFAALGDSTRLAIFDRLSDGKPRSISTLSDDADMTRQAVTKHLRVLEAAGLVQNHRVGRESQYAFCAEQLEQARAYLDQVSNRWESALMRLKTFVEGEGS